MRSAHSLRGALAATLILGSLAAAPVKCDPIADAGRQVISKQSAAVITVLVTARVSYSSDGEQTPKREVKSESTGIIVDPSGLVAMPLSAASPEDLYAAYMGEGGDMKIQSEIADMKIMLADGTQMTGRIVLRDKDLDLAFVRPVQKPAAPLPAIDASKASTPGQLDEVLLMLRLGTVASRSISATVERIDAVIQKPRMFFVINSLDAPGMAVFALDGTPVGMVTMRTLPGAGRSDSGSVTAMPIILPMSDIAEAAAQAPTTVPAAAAPAPAQQKPAAPAKPAAKPAANGK